MSFVFLGDSLTHGGYGGNWVDIVADSMPHLPVINAGVGGDTVVNLLARVDSVLEKYLPTAMFVMVGGNDAVSYTMPDTRLYYKNTKNIKPDGIVTPELFATSYRDLLTHLQLQHIETFVGLPPTEYNAKLIEARKQYNALTWETARALNIATLDLATPFIPSAPIEREDVSLKFIQQIGQRASSGWNDYENERVRMGYSYTFDGMHLTPDSAEKMAGLVVKFLQSMGF
jgi:lysophospholipase L1-like esterase